MLSTKTYTCGICITKPDQLSHHKSHVETQKHQDKRELFELKLGHLTQDELVDKYMSNNVKDIVLKMETIVNEPEKMNNKQSTDNTTNNTIFREMDECTMISNKEALRDKIHEIHNYLRNNGAGYGMNALKVFNIIYGLKKIEENKLLDKVKLKRPECEFSHLLQLANDNKDEELAYCIYNPVLDSIAEQIRELLFYEIPRNMKGATLSYLVKEIDKITILEKKCNVQLSGKIYEYFIGRDESAISELGAYFTDRHIVEYIYNKLNPKLTKDGTIKTMIDMFGGSGGFTTGYINYLIKHNPKKINWETEINKISHFDINEDVIKSAGLEFFCLTGQFPNMTKCLRFCNAFTSEFTDKYDYIVTNPPYGGDKVSKSTNRIKRDKIKKYILEELKTSTDKKTIEKREKQLAHIAELEKEEKKYDRKNKVTIDGCSALIQKYAKEHGLSGNDKECASLVLMMSLLAKNGICVGVLKEGVFFNKIYSKLRACLIKNFNVREVISVSADQFENTKTKTSIIFFDNTSEKTTCVRFSELIIERCDKDEFEEINDTIVLKSSKGDIIDLKDKLISTATFDDIMADELHTLNGKNYVKKNIHYNGNYKMVKLVDICTLLPKSKRKASYGQQTGKYNFITSSNKIQRCNTNDYEKKCIIIGTGGNSCIHIDENFSCSGDTFVIEPKNIDIKYIYYSLLIMWNTLKDKMHGSTIEHLDQSTILNFQIPIPKSDKLLKDWVDKISKPFDAKNQLQQKLHEREKYVMDNIKEICENEECDEVKLDDLCKIKFGTRITRENPEKGDVPVFGGGDITFYTNKHNNRDAGTLIVSRYAISCNCVRIIPYNFYLNDSGLSLECKKEIYQRYVNYYFLTDAQQKYIYSNCTMGSIQKNLSMNLFKRIEIPIPKDKKLLSKLDKQFIEIENLRKQIDDAEALYKQYINELTHDIQLTEDVQTTESVDVESDEQPTEELKKPVKKQVSNKKPKVV